MNDTAVIAILNGGGVLAFAFMVWRSIEKMGGEVKASVDKGSEDVAEALDKMSARLDRMTERMARIDDRTFRADTEGDYQPQRKRARTPVAGVPRSKAPTPFTGGDDE